MEIVGVVSEKWINYQNYHSCNYSHPDSQRLAIVTLADGTQLSRWNEIPRKFVTSNHKIHQIARKKRLLQRFSTLTNIDISILKKAIKYMEYALPGESVAFIGKVIGSQIKGRISKIK